MQAMDLRPYQQEAREAVWHEWDSSHARTLLVMVTGGGKTIIFARIIADCVMRGERVLVLAHRGELLEQAADKLERSTGLKCSVEKADQTCLDSWYRVVVGSVQSLQQPKRLEKFDRNFFDTIIVDEAHHCLSDGYQRVLDHFDQARVLGVTATPDRGDMRDLGQYFDSIAYEYTLPRAIKEGYLCKIRALTIPIQIDLSSVRVQSGDYSPGDVGSALDPYLEKIADEMRNYCMDRKTVVFLPLIKTSQKFCRMLKDRGFKAAEVNGESLDRAETLIAFDKGEYNVLCNSMLLTEGWDCPSVDCIVVLRPTKVRSLYVQMIGRGTRLSPGKDHLLLLDFLWMTSRHDLCRPAHLICTDPEVADRMVANMEDNLLLDVDLEEAEAQAESDAAAAREEALAKKLAEMRHRKRKLVDPLQYEMSIGAMDLTNYVPIFGKELDPPTEAQKKRLEAFGIFPDEIDSFGKAGKLLERLESRQNNSMARPKQIRFLESKGFLHVGTWSFTAANNMISRIQKNNWRVPYDVIPNEYVPPVESSIPNWDWPF
jgi:superfamily II DNA or RNA helicase